MRDILRDSTMGVLANSISGGAWFPYPDQRPEFVIPEKYLASSVRLDNNVTKTEDGPLKPSLSKDQPVTSQLPGTDENTRADYSTPNAGKFEKFPPGAAEDDLQAHAGGHNITSDEARLEGIILVDWYSEDDPENPQNWSTYKKALVVFEICLLNVAVYIGAAIYTPSIPYIGEVFGVSNVVATLGLSLFVEGYALGPMVFSPLQEIPSLGRNPGYIVTLAIFVIIQIPAALSTNIGGLLVIRFLSGFFGSPALATGGGTIADMYSPMYFPYTIGLWSGAGFLGPTLGPVVGGFAAAKENWRWPLWELAWISGFTVIFLAFLLPETLHGTILLKRARRLRKLTGNDKLRSLSEIEQAEMRPSEVAKTYLIRPFQLMLEPSVLFINIYFALVYAVFYLWFESFPLVFTGIYGFEGGIGGLPFLSLIVGVIFSYTFYAWYNMSYLHPRFIHKFLSSPPPEEYLRLSCFAGIFIPVSLFIFGWGSRPSVHWIVPTIGAGLYVPGIFLLLQSAAMYLAISYSRYTASIFAGNALFRSSLAASFPLFGKTFYDRLGLGGGSSLLAGISILMIPFMCALFLYGSRLRALSKYAQ